MSLIITAIAARLVSEAHALADAADKGRQDRPACPSDIEERAHKAAALLEKAKGLRTLAETRGKTEYSAYCLEKAQEAERQAHLEMNSPEYVEYYGRMTLRVG